MNAKLTTWLASWSTVAEILTTCSLIFGGCCSNALTLEVITSEYPPSGTLITFAQFLFVTLVGLRKQLFVLPKRMRRQEVIQRIAEMSAKSRVISFYGIEDHATVAFAHELASAVGGIFSDSIDEVQASNAELCPLPNTKGPFNVVRNSSEWGKSLSPFKVFLQIDAVSIHTADAVIDISVPTRPAFLHPRAFEVTFNPLRYRLRRRKIPLLRYIVQVVLFLVISLLNNAAFAYRVPMAVHIIFRSGGLVANMLLGWVFEKRRYSTLQIESVVLVTLGVVLTTFSATQSKSKSISSVSVTSAATYSRSGSELHSYGNYAIGIAILTLALLLSGILGITQDRTFRRYGRGNWEEAMFYLHALALPLFGFTWPELAAQTRAINSGLQVPLFKGMNSGTLLPLPHLPIHPPTLRIPAFYIPLVLNVFTQLLCVAGVNRLTSRVNSLTVSLVLVVRKAVSLVISVLLLGGSRGNVYLWSGAAAVFVGTVGYAMASHQARTKAE